MDEARNLINTKINPIHQLDFLHLFHQSLILNSMLSSIKSGLAVEKESNASLYQFSLMATGWIGCSKD